MSLVRVILFRHGQTDWNLQNRWQGLTDVPLNEFGKIQSINLAKTLEADPIEHIVTSHLNRAIETGKIISEHLKIPLTVIQNLQEVDLGDAEGKTKFEIFKSFSEKAYHEFYDSSSSEIGIPNSEGKVESALRARLAIESAIRLIKVKNIGICTHGTLLRRFYFHLFPHSTTPLKLDNCQPIVLNFNLVSSQWHP